jgi:GR25 family glycosyltransferase involved in LPS biosynthesis
MSEIKKVNVNGLNNFDIVYFINLDIRADRYLRITDELQKTNIIQSKINKVSGHYLPHFGSLGCTLSHIDVLKKFIDTDETIQTCIIFEDDFVFTQEQNIINDTINLFFNEVDEWDVLALSFNIFQHEATDKNYLVKVIEGQAASGYCVHKRFAKILLDNYEEGKIMLEKTNILEVYSVDQYMKKIQPMNKWYCLNPKIGKQGESYSDISKMIVDYGC